VTGTQVVEDILEISTKLYATIGYFSGTVTFGSYTLSANGVDGFFAGYSIDMNDSSILTDLWVVSCPDGSRGDAGKTLVNVAGQSGAHLFFDLADTSANCEFRDIIAGSTTTINRSPVVSGAGLYLRQQPPVTFSLIDGNAGAFVVM